MMIPIPHGATLTADANGVLSVTGAPHGWRPTPFSFSRQRKSDNRDRDGFFSIFRRWFG